MTHTRDFVLPDLGEGLESAEITTWLVEEGQSIELNQVLCLVETAKAVVEVPSPFAGRISKRHGDEGDEIPVGTILVSIEVAGEAPPSAGDVAGPPVLVGYGTSPGASRRRRNRSASVQASTPDRVRAKPAVRQRARELGVDIASLAPGSGPGETITRADVEAAAAAPPAPDTAPATEPAEPADTAPATEPAAATTPEASIGSGRTIELRGIRAIIADRMTVSRRTIPDASCGLAVDASRLLAIRSRLQDDEPDRSADVTPFTMILAATVQALHRWPMLNATLDEANRTIHLLDDIHLGIATATEHGLMVPVLHDAHRCSLADMAAETRRLAAGARDRSLAPSELMGSTFTVSNFGAFGVDDGVPVINHPEAAILGIGAIAPRPWVANDALSVRSAVTLTVAFDHRVCDGAEAAGFLRTLGDLIENAELDLDSPLLAR